MCNPYWGPRMMGQTKSKSLYNQDKSSGIFCLSFISIVLEKWTWHAKDETYNFKWWRRGKYPTTYFFVCSSCFFLSFSLASTKILLVTIIQNKRNEKKIIFWGVLFPYFFNKLTEELREETFETKFYLNFEGEWLQNPCSLQSGH